MKQKNRKTIRRWIGMILSLCVFLSMVPAGAFADDPFYQTYTGGVTDNTHAGDNDPLGDLILPADYETEEGVTDFGALVLDFPDGEGGAKVEIQTGDLEAEGDQYSKEVTEDFYGMDYTHTVTSDGYGAIIRMDDSSTLELTTGCINSNGSGVKADVNETSSLALTIEGATTAANDGISLESYNGSRITVNAGEIKTGDSALTYEGNDGSRFTANTQGIEAGGTGASMSLEEGSVGTVNVNGSIEAGYTGINLTTYDSAGSISSGAVSSDGAGIGVYAHGGSAEVDVTGDVNAGQGTGIGLQGSYDSDISVDVTGSVTVEDGRGVNITNGAWENDGKLNMLDVSIGGSVTSSDMAFYVNNNYGIVDIQVGGNEEIEDAGNITSGGSYSAFLEADPDSTIHFTAGDVTGSNDTSSVRPQAHGNNAVVTVDIGNVTNDSGYGIQGTTEGINSLVDIDAGDLDAAGIGLAVHSEDAVVVGNTEDGSYAVYNGTVNADVGTVTSGYNGIYATLEDGTINVNSGAVDAAYNGVQASTSGFDSGSGITINVDGNVSAGAAGIAADSYENNQALAYESGELIMVLENDPHENWWEKTRYDEDGLFIWVSTGEGDDIQWTKYRSSYVDYEYEGYSEEDLALPVFWDLYDEYVDFVPVGFETVPDNFINISTGGVQAGEAGVVTNNNGGTFDITVDGGVTVEGPEYDVYVDDWDGTTYVYYNDADGITATNTAGTTSIAVNGDLSVSCITDGNDAPVGEGANQGRYNGNGVTIGNYGGEINIDITGDVNTESGTAISIEPRFDYYDWEFEDLNGDALVNIGGDVTAENGVNVGTNGGGTGHTTINISGSLTTTGSGLVIGQEVPVNPWAETEGDEPDESLEGNGAEEEGENQAEATDPAVDIIVQETISGLTPILVSNMEAVTNVLITTWAVIPNENGNITEDENGNSVEALEENINYIIKKEDNEYGTLTVSGTNAKITPDDTELAVAKQDTLLSLTVNLLEQYSQGYDVIIYNGIGDNKLEADVTKEENGSFTFMVPWAGGVYLTFGVASNGQATPDPDPDEPDPDEPDPDEPDPDEPDPVEPDPDEPDPDEPDPVEPDPDEPDPDEPDPDEPDPDEPDPDEPDPEEPDPEEPDPDEPDPDEPDQPDEPDPDEPDPDEPDEPESEATDPAAIIADADISDAGNGRVLAILYGEKTDGIEEDYIIWFLSGYGYRAKFRDGYTEYGTYRVKDDELTLTARDGSERTVTDRVIAFDEERKAQIVKTDFSDSVKIIGEFNVNDEDILEITDRELKAISLTAIHETIDNPYAWEILTAILTEKAE